jgi:hypothetical protein
MAEKKISRRDAMKILGVAAGAAAFSTLPSKWNTPELAAGVLPAHARQSVIGHSIQSALFDQSIPASLASICFPFGSTATIKPAVAGILLRYTITSDTVGILSPVVVTVPPVPAILSGQVATNASGQATISNVSVDMGSLTPGLTETVTVTWSFVNPSDGSGSSSQNLTGGGC